MLQVNANVNLWYKEFGAQEGAPFKLMSVYADDPFGDPFNTVGLQISTKKPGQISYECLREVSVSVRVSVCGCVCVRVCVCVCVCVCV